MPFGDADVQAFGEGDAPAVPPFGQNDALAFGAADVPAFGEEDTPLEAFGQNLLEIGKGIPEGAVGIVGTALKGLGALSQSDRAAMQLWVDLLRGAPQASPEDRAAWRKRAFAELTKPQAEAFQRALSDIEAGDDPAEAAEIMYPLFSAETVRETPFFEAGEATTEFAKGLVPAAPGYEESIGRQLGVGLGSVAAGAGAGLLPGGQALGPAMFALAGSGEAADRAVRAGASEDQIIEAARKGIIPGMTDSLPVETLLGRIPVPGGKLIKVPVGMLGTALRAVGRIGWQAFIEGVQEGGQGFLQNLIARDIYAPEQKLGEGVVPEAGIGAGVGAIAETGRLALKGFAGRRGGGAIPVPQMEGPPLPEGAQPAEAVLGEEFGEGDETAFGAGAPIVPAPAPPAPAPLPEAEQLRRKADEIEARAAALAEAQDEAAADLAEIEEGVAAVEESPEAPTAPEPTPAAPTPPPEPPTAPSAPETAPGALPRVRGKPAAQPKGPIDMLRFLATKGGIRDDEGHDLARGRGGARFIPGVGPLIRPTGMIIDDAGEALWEAGYFGPPDTTPRPTEAEVLDKLDAAFRAHKLLTPEQQAGAVPRETDEVEIEQAAANLGVELESGDLSIVKEALGNGLDLEDAIERAAIQAEAAVVGAYVDITPDAEDITFDAPAPTEAEPAAEGTGALAAPQGAGEARPAGAAPEDVARGEERGRAGEAGPSPEYEAASQEVREATEKFRSVQEDYRAQRIGDDEYLAARAEYEAVEKRFDEAFAAEAARPPAPTTETTPDLTPPSEPTAPPQRRARGAERLRDAGERLKERAEGSLGQDRLANTARRARMAAGAEASASADRRIAETALRIASAVTEDTAGPLSDVTSIAEVRELESALQRAMRTADKDLSYAQQEQRKGRRPEDADIALAKIEPVFAHNDNLKDLLAASKGKRGLGDARRIVERIQGRSQTYGPVTAASEIEALKKVATAAKSKEKYAAARVLDQIKDRERLAKIGITTDDQLADALRAYVDHRGERPKADPIKEAERALIGIKIPGFFQTPAELAERMIEEADISPEHTILEPSAGAGRIADVITAEVGKERLTVIEPSSTLRNILELKGYSPLAEDFLDHTAKYDKIVMNPPFEQGQDIDHVQHAYELLNPNGRIVAIMSPGPFSGQDKKRTAFREWFDEVGGTVEDLPEGAFKESGTGVSSRFVVIDKAPITEPTPQGEQAVIPGAERIGDRELAERGMEGRKKPARPQAEPDEGLFDTGARRQGDIFDRKPDEDERSALRRDAAAKPLDTGALQKRLADLGMADKVAFKVVEQIGRGAGTEGRYVNRAITVAMDAADGVWTLNHEAVHALRDMDLIRPGEWKTLAAMAKADAPRLDEIRERYAGQPLNEDQLIEEAVADTFADWADGRAKVAGPIRLLFERIRVFLQKLGNALKGEGFTSAAEVFGRVERGEVGRRGFEKEVTRGRRSLEDAGAEPTPGTIQPRGQFSIGLSGRQSPEEIRDRLDEIAADFGFEKGQGSIAYTGSIYREFSIKSGRRYVQVRTRIADHPEPVSRIEQGFGAHIDIRPGEFDEAMVASVFERARAALGEEVGRRPPPGRAREPRERLSLSPETPDSSEARQDAQQGFIASGQPLDRAMRIPFDWFGGVNEKGEWKPGAKLFDKAKKTVTGANFSPEGRFSWLNGPLEAARFGLIDRYGLAEEYVTRERKRDLDARAIAVEGADILKTLAEQNVQIEEARVLQAILTGEDVADADMAKLAVPIRQAVDELGQEAVSLGLVSAESYERNRGSYLHRVYMKHEADQPHLSRWFTAVMTGKRKKILGDALKGRGMFLEIERARMMRDIPAFAEGARGVPRKGELYTVLDKYAAQEELEQIGAGPARIERRVYWPAEEAIPDRYKDFTNNGDWEVRGAKGKKIVLWRDYTKTERERMGEITDARYTIGKTFMLMANDLATGRFYKDIAENEEWSRTDQPDGKWVDAAEFGRLWHDQTVEWVRAPETAIPKSGGKKRWGALAGRWVRPEIWRDLNEIDAMSRPNMWTKLLTQWKLNKTARSPVVHMNNIMSNFVFMDLADVRIQDLVRGIRAYATGSADFREAADHGAFGADIISQEIRREVLMPILKDLEREMTGTANPALSRFGALGGIAGAIWDKGKMVDRKMVDMYRLEDEIFRMGMYMRRRSLGESAEDAALEARQQFLDYDIRAPWVNMARRSVLPFIAYSYRAAPLIARSIATRPWKLGKYFMLAYAANALAYMVAPSGDDEEKERRSIRDAERGYTWIGVPRMMRMPYRDEFGNPVFLDIRRWVPAGDIFDLSQGHGAFNMPAPLQFGGPLMLGAELAFNKSAFTGDPITGELTDTGGEAAAKIADHLWKSWMPSAAWVPGSWYWNKIGLSMRGAVDSTGRPYPLPEAVASSFGIKLKPQDVEQNLMWRRRELDKARRGLNYEQRRLGRLRDRNVLSEESYLEGLTAIDAKRRNIDKRELSMFPPR